LATIIAAAAAAISTMPPAASPARNARSAEGRRSVLDAIMRCDSVSLLRRSIVYMAAEGALHSKTRTFVRCGIAARHVVARRALIHRRRAAFRARGHHFLSF